MLEQKLDFQETYTTFQSKILRYLTRLAGENELCFPNLRARN